MEIIKKLTQFDFLGRRKAAIAGSLILIVICIASLTMRGLNFGIDFTGGTLVEVGYAEGVNVSEVRSHLAEGGYDDAVVQYFGTANDILVRLPVQSDEVTGAELSSAVMQSLRQPFSESLVEGQSGSIQQCVVHSGQTADCQVQMRRVEFVGPQVGEELTEQGGLAMIYALIMILIYIWVRFEWHFSLGSVAALVHDVLVTVGLFSIFQLEFSLPVLAAVLAVIGYSLNDTIVVFDRIRENFRKIRKGSAIEIMNRSINQTLPRTLLTSITTLLVLIALVLFGGEVIRGFAIALIIGVLVGTYSSIFIASPVVLMLGISKEDLIQPVKEGADQDKVLP